MYNFTFVFGADSVRYFRMQFLPDVCRCSQLISDMISVYESLNNVKYKTENSL